jgi:glucose/arabinose dehydrogenase
MGRFIAQTGGLSAGLQRRAISLSGRLHWHGKKRKLRRDGATPVGFGARERRHDTAEWFPAQGRLKMTGGFSARRAMLLAGTFGTLVLAALPAAAQQSPAPAAGAAPTPPPSWAQGRPTGEGAMKLAPVAPPPIPTAADKLPDIAGKLKLQKGFNIEVYASGVANARSMRQGDKGTIFVGSRLQDKVHAIVEKGGKREVKVIASGLHRPNGLAIKDGTLYIAELSKISKIEKIEDNLDNPPKPTMVYDNLPKDEPHGWKFIAIGPDNKLYIPVGAPCNICEPPDTHAQIRRINLDGSGMEVVARGVRNTVGFDWHPVSKELYFTDNGRDWVAEDVPEDELNRVTKVGQHFGFPFCHQGDFLDPEFGWGKSCDSTEKPVMKTGPHSASLGMRFYTGGNFPAKYKNAIFFARHGSWNRTKKVGGDIVAVFLNKDGTVKSTETFITGFLGPDNNYIGRPVDVLFAKDGSMLISDDFNGAVWRVTHGNPKSAAVK